MNTSDRTAEDPEEWLVKSFQPTIDELEVLAHHHLNELRRVQFWWRVTEQGGGSENRAYSFAYQRLARIEGVLGAERLTAAIAGVEEKWDKEFAEADEEEKALKPCRICGEKRNLRSLLCIREGDFCEGCGSKWQRESRW